MTSVSKLTRLRAFLIIVAFGGFILIGMPDAMRGVAGPSIREEFSLPLDALGLWLLASTCGYLIASFFSGRVLARLGTGRALAAACALTGVGILGYAITPSYPVMILIGLGVGLGMGTIDAGLNNFVATNYSPSLMYWLHAMFGLGATLGPAVMNTVLQNQQTWRVAYVIVGIAALILALIVMLTAKRWTNPSQSNLAAPEQQHTPISATLRLPDARLGIAIFFIYAGIEFIPNEWAYSVMTLSRGIDADTAARWMVIYWLAFTVGRVLSGFITMRLAERTYIRLTMIGMVIGAALFAFNFSQDLSLLSLGILGFSIAPLFPSLINNTAQRVGAEHAANTIGFQIAATGSGVGILTSISGVIARAVSLEVIGIILCIIAIIVVVLHELILSRLQQREQSVIPTGIKT